MNLWKKLLIVMGGSAPLLQGDDGVCNRSSLRARISWPDLHPILEGCVRLSSLLKLTAQAVFAGGYSQPKTFFLKTFFIVAPMPSLS